MRRLFSILMVLLCLCSCKDKASVFVLEGNVGRLTHDTIYIYGGDALYEQMDTIIATNGAFHHTMNVDTVVPLWVLFPNNHREMLFADKGLSVVMHGDTAAMGHIRIVGGEQNALLQSFYQHTDSIGDIEEITQIADSFIRANPYSEVSIYLLKEYLVDIPSPNHAHIKRLIDNMSGNLQDNNYISLLQTNLNEQKPLTRNNLISNYSVCDYDGKYVSHNDYKDTYLLISFWASWDKDSRIRQRELIALKDKFKKRKFDILSVSLDSDRKAWEEAIKHDSLTWRQANEFEGWNTGIVKRLQIHQLPANVLLSPSRRIQAINLYGAELEKKVDELTKQIQSPKNTQKKTPQTIRSKKSTPN